MIFSAMIVPALDRVRPIKFGDATNVRDGSDVPARANLAENTLQNVSHRPRTSQSARLHRRLWGAQPGLRFLPGDIAFIGSKLACQAYLMFAEGDLQQCAVEAIDEVADPVANLDRREA